MVTCKNNFLILIVLFLSINTYLFSQEINLFNGIWRCRSTLNPNDDAYIAINKTGDNEFFVIYIDPFWGNRYNYSAYGLINNNGYIHVIIDEIDFYLELSRSGSLYHYIRSLNDPQVSRFEKVAGSENTTIDNVSLEDFLEFIKLMVSD